MQEIQEKWIRPLSQQDPLEKKLATHSSILTWEIPWTEGTDSIQSMGSQSWTQLSTSAHTVQGFIYHYTDNIE